MFRMKGRVKAKVDILCIAFIVLGVFFATACFTYIQANMYLAVLNIFHISAIGISLGFGALFRDRLDLYVTKAECLRTAFLIAIGFALTFGFQFLILNSTTKLSVLDVDIWGKKLFYGTAGIAESCLFQWVLLTTMERGTGGAVVASLVSSGFVSGLFALFHAAVYGLSNQLLVLAIWSNSMVFCVLYVFSGYQVLVPIAIHFLINVVVPV